MTILSRFNSSTLLLTVAFLLTAISLLPSIPLNCNSAHAATSSPSDYCFQTDVAIDYSGGGTLTNYPVRVELPSASMVSANQLDERAWDIYSMQGSFSNNQHLLMQEVGDATSGNWIIVPEISAAGGTENFRWYTGQSETRRDQSIYFTGVETAATPDHANFDITDNLNIYFTITNHDDTPRTEVLFDRWNPVGTAGFQVQFHAGAPYTLRLYLDNSPCPLTWNSAWNDTKQDFHVQYISDAGLDTFIYRNGVLEASCDIDEGTIGTNSIQPTLGSSYVGANPLSSVEVHSFQLYDNTTEVAHWEFSADHMEETVETNPFQGTIEDMSANGHDLSYTFTRPQTSITTSVTATQVTNLSGVGAISQELVDILGGVLPSDATSLQSEQTGSIFHNLFLEPVAQTGFSRQVSLTLVLTALGILIAVGVYLKTNKQFMPLSVMLGGFPIWLGAFNGWVPWWYAGTWAMLTLFTWFAFRRSEEAG